MKKKKNFGKNSEPLAGTSPNFGWGSFFYILCNTEIERRKLQMTTTTHEVKRRWYNAEFTKENAKIFTEFLKEHRIQFEPSEAGNLVHFQLNLSIMELATVNAWIFTFMNERK